MAQQTASQRVDRAAPLIRVRDGGGQVVDVIRLNRGSITVGSASHNAIVLPSNHVAPAQLRMDWDGASSSVTVTDLGSTAETFIGPLRIQPHASLTWDGSQVLRIGPFTLKFIAAPAPSETAVSSNNAPLVEQRPAQSRWPLWLRAAIVGLLTLAAIGITIYGVLSRPAQILSFTFNDSGEQRLVQFEVSNARRIAFAVNGQPADLARLAYDAQTGAGAYQPDAQENEFELSAYNALDQPTSSRLTLPPAATPTPTPTPTPNPTATPLPNELFIANFSFNGVNKANDLSDLVIRRGDPLVIEWNVANATSVELQPAGTFNARDSIRVAPLETTVYTLVARNAEGEASRSIRVVVVDAQATAAVNATASAVARATQDVLKVGQAQAGATATASAQTTATAIANQLATAVAAAQVQATQNAQAIVNATVTAAAQATLGALSTAEVNATQQAQAAADATATAIAQNISQSDAARFSQFNGTWVNDDPTAIGVTRLVISNTGASITVQAYGRCQPQDCLWGSRTQTFTQVPLTVRYDFGDGSSHTLRLERADDKLRVEDIDSRRPVWTYTFSPQ